MDESGIVIRRQQHQQQLQPHQQQQFLQTPPVSRSYGGGGGGNGGISRLMRESSGECVSSSEDEHLAGETLFEARVSIHSRKKSSKGQVHFEQDAADRVLQLQGDQLKLKKKDKLKAKTFVYYVWVRRNVSDYVPSDSHRIKDESLAVLAGWYKDLMIVTFATSGEKERFLLTFQTVNLETLRRLYNDEADPCEKCQISVGSCIPVDTSTGSPPSGAEATSPGTSHPTQTLIVKPYETANDVVRKCKAAFRLDPGLRVQLCLEGVSVYCMVGCESIFATVLYQIHDRHKSERRRGSVLSEASSTSPNDSNSVDLDESIARDAARVRLSLHAQDSCSAGACSAAKKKKQPHQHQTRRASEVPGKIRSWIANNRRSQLSRQGSVEFLSATANGGNSSSGSVEPSPIIGRSLTELYPSGIVSRPVTCLLAHIYHRCYTVRGIFRQPGSVSEKNQVLQLLSQYDLAKTDNLPQLNSFGEHCIADALKHYLRNLPGYLLQKNLADQWSRIGREIVEEGLNQQAAIAQIRNVIKQMQPQNAHLLHMLMTALRRVADNHEQNQMTPANIGTSVSFSVLDLDLQGASLATMEQDAQRINKLIELMIANFDDIWPDDRANARALADFARHICQTDDPLSSTESLTVVDGDRQPEVPEPLSLSSLSKDSGLQLSDQQLDDTRRSASAAAAAVTATPVEIPERQHPPPYDIAMKRQARSQRSRQQQQQQQKQPLPLPSLPYQEVTAAITPRRERPPVPARMNRRPASVGPGGSGSSGGSGRQPLPAGFDPLAESKSRHPLMSSAKATVLATSTTTATATPSSRPVKVAPVAASASVAAAATAAAQRLQSAHLQQQQQQLLLQQPRFRKRSSSETRLELLGLESSGQQPFQSPFGQPRQQHQHQHQYQNQHQHLHHPDGDEAVRYRRHEFERLNRLHTRESFDSSAVGGRQSRQQHFSSRHAPMRGPPLSESCVTDSPRQHQSQHQPQPRPRTRLPEPLQRRLANQPESLV